MATSILSKSRRLLVALVLVAAAAWGTDLQARSTSCSAWCNPDCYVYAYFCDGCQIWVNQPICTLWTLGNCSEVGCQCVETIFWDCGNSWEWFLFYE